MSVSALVREGIERIRKEARERQKRMERGTSTPLISKAEARTKLLESLSDDELMTIYRWAQAEYNTTWQDISPEQIRAYFQNLSGKKLTRVLCLLYFNNYGGRAWKKWGKVYQWILMSLAQFKEKLRDSPYARDGSTPSSKPNTELCWDGCDLRAWNKHTGEVCIAKHALQRFRERAGIRKIRDTQRLLEKFRASFARAELIEIDPVEKVKSIINNDFKQAIYLLDKPANIRFVLPETKRGEQLTIATVVRPR